MSQQSVDTRTTAYVFGELNAEQRIAFERELRNSQQLRDEVAAIRDAVTAISAELSAEHLSMPDDQRRQVERAIEGATVPVKPDRPADDRRWLSLLALAASLLLIVGLVVANLPGDREISMRDQPSPRATSEPNDVGSVESDPDGRNVSVTLKSQLEVAQQANLQLRQELQQVQVELQKLTTAGASQPAMEPSLDDLSRTADGDRLATNELGMQAQPGANVERAITVDQQMQGPELQGQGPELQGQGPELQGQGPELQGQVASRGRNQLGDGQTGDDLALRTPRRQRGVESAESAQNSPSAAGLESYEMMMGMSGEYADAAAVPSNQPLPKQSRRSQAPYYSQLGGYGGQGGQQNPQGAARAIRGSRAASAGAADPGRIARQRFNGSDATAGGVRESMSLEDMIASDGSNAVASNRELAAVGGAADQKSDEFGITDGAEIVAGEAADTMGIAMTGGMGPGMAGDQFEPVEDNPFMDVRQEELSTFSIDVDTASYAKVRMYLMQQNVLPRPAAVRIEELVNYFSYQYEPPTDQHPFSAAVDIGECPWNTNHRLARVGIKGRVLDRERPSSNLVFLLDVSGSMNRPNKLPLVIDGMTMLTEQLNENDSVAIVVYAGAAGLVLESTSGDQKRTIVESLTRLHAGGSTNGGEGIKLAYQIARDNFVVGGTNRVILCSDGDFNVGLTGNDQLVEIVQQNSKSNIYLSVLGFGMGNHNDAMMEQISNKGNGNYAFIDSLSEAHKVLVEQIGGTLVTIAKDVKIQVEFNPKEISAYRLIGYENRMLEAQDFNDDTKDAGEIGAGHTVTALYELIPVEAQSEVVVPSVDELRYQRKARLTEEARSGEMLTLKLRYKQPDAQPDAESTLIQFPVIDSGKDFSEMDLDYQFAASVASFGMLLRHSPHQGDATYSAVEEIASACINPNDKAGYRQEFLALVAKAKQLSGE